MLAPNPLAERRRTAALGAAIVCVAVVGIGLSLSIPLLSLEMERKGASSTLIGLNTAVGGIASIVTVPFVPRLAQRLGVLRLLVGAIVLAAATLIGFKLLDELAIWFPLRFVFSAALGALFVLSEFWISDAAPAARRGLVMGIYASVLALGFAIGPGLLVLVGTQGFPPYLAGAALFLIAALPILLARDLEPHIAEQGRRRFLGYVRLAPAATMAALVYGAVETGGFAILPLYGLRLGFDAQEAAGLVSLVALGNVLFQIPIGLVSDRIDRRLLLLVASLAGLVGAAALPLVAGSPLALSAVLFLWGGLAGSIYTIGLAHLGASVEPVDLAGANAAFIVLYSIGLVLGPPVIGGGMDLVPPHGFAFALALMFAAYAVLVVVRLKTGTPPPHAPLTR